uniref:Uncharacterized protein n=1 Tax=Arundo donax TaxID=35708 RepID=A0A0A8YI08_ARUDO
MPSAPAPLSSNPHPGEHMQDLEILMCVPSLAAACCSSPRRRALLLPPASTCTACCC